VYTPKHKKIYGSTSKQESALQINGGRICLLYRTAQTAITHISTAMMTNAIIIVNIADFFFKDVERMKIFLDDTRETPSKLFNCVRTYEQCITLLSVFTNDIEFIDLDYNLGKNSYSGLDVLIYMHDNGIYPNHINIHSSHERGASKMMEYAEKYFPNSSVTANKVRA
jgi:hypothetical protein